jgi:hypothetical protein
MSYNDRLLRQSPLIRGILRKLQETPTGSTVDLTPINAALSEKASLVHTHYVSEVEGLQSILDGKSAFGHTHTIAETAGLQAALDGKQALLTNPVTGTGSAGQLAFFNAATGVAGSSNLSWDNTNARFGINVTPTSTLHIRTGGNTTATSIVIQNSAGTDIFKIRDDGKAAIGNTGISGNHGLMVQGNFSASYVYGTFVVSTNIGADTSFYMGYGGGGIQTIRNSTNATNTSGAINGLWSSVGFAPTSGTATYSLFNASATINQTGGANGITRGLLVSPTLTAAFDWRSIEWANNSGWGLYGVGTAANYINGSLLLGSLTNTGERLQVTGSSKLNGRVNLLSDAAVTTQSMAVIINTSTNGGIALVPNGSGAITAQIPDGTTAGGNARGGGAVDLQVTRINAGKVASGWFSFAVGNSNTASGQESFAAGFNSTAGGRFAFALGYQVNAGGYGAHA